MHHKVSNGRGAFTFSTHSKKLDDGKVGRCSLAMVPHFLLPEPAVAHDARSTVPRYGRTTRVARYAKGFRLLR